MSNPVNRAQGEEWPSQPPPASAPEGGQPAAMPPPMEHSSTGVGQPADLLNRFLARLVDFVLLFVVNMVLVSVVIVGAVMGSSAGAFGVGEGAGYAASAVMSILTAALYLGYFAVMESRTGRTLGKMALKLETRGPGGGKPSLEEALKRNAFTALGVLGIVPLIGGVVGGLASLAAVIAIAVTINSSATRQGWHDTFAGGTSVVKVG
jgi:uncharacterized RDD family membrane protein YckC